MRSPEIAPGPASPEVWWLLRQGRNRAASNMAFDDALLAAMPRLARPVLRFYEWAEPAATFGYSQRYADVARWTPLRPLIRRPTGGGLVAHDRSFTYTLAVPPGHSWYGLRARESYARMHDWLGGALRQQGWETELAPPTAAALPGDCFVRPEQHDVLWRGVKVAGAAQRRTRSGLLIQGAVQPPAGGPEAGTWREAVLRLGSERWGIRWEELAVPDWLAARAEELTRQKYDTALHNEGR